jgi:hypothetical protein
MQAYRPLHNTHLTLLTTLHLPPPQHTHPPPTPNPQPMPAVASLPSASPYPLHPCPRFCAKFTMEQLQPLFTNKLINHVQLDIIPYGNAHTDPNTGTVSSSPSARPQPTHSPGQLGP